MKFLVVLILIVAGTTALHLPKGENQSKNPAIQHDGRIAGGEDADIRKFNYQVGLALTDSLQQTFTCSGSLVAHNWVLTAAHCTQGIYKINVYLGSANYAHGEVAFKIIRSDDNVIEHELYDNKSKFNDIALIRIPTVQYSQNITPVRLVKPGGDVDALVNQYATASGWGDMGDHAMADTMILQSVTLRIISNVECTEAFTDEHIYDGSICLATNDDIIMRSPCPGDSGGPLVIRGTNIQIGLTSFGSSIGCEVGLPAVFTPVSYFMDWIVEKTGLTL